jgi:hypothetical protein
MSDPMRGYLALLLTIGASACASIAGVDGDYHEVDPDASAGGSSAGGSGGSSNGGSTNGGGSGNGGTGAGGTGAVGGVAGAAGAAGAAAGAAGAAGGSTCSAFCAGAVPATFAGPIILYESAGTPPACDASYPTEVAANLRSGLTAGTAQCDCNCSTPTITCGSPSTHEHGNSQCFGGAFLGSMTPNVCKLFTVGAGNYVSVDPLTPTLGTCSSSNAHSIPPPTWGTQARSCGAPTLAGECNGSEVCVPPQPSGTKLCVYKTGDVSCPAGFYSSKKLFHDDFDDTRQCSTCSCSSATGGQCKGTVTFTNGATCGSAQLSLSLGACSNAPASNVNGGKYTPGSHTPGSCSPQGGVLSGSVTATGPVTYCCAP